MNESDSIRSTLPDPGAQKELSIEEAFAQIRELLTEMESEDVSLERSFDDYEKGMKLIRLCSEKIDAVEKKVQLLNADGTTQDFA